MVRRVNLPSADDLFRPTTSPSLTDDGEDDPAPVPVQPLARAPHRRSGPTRGPAGSQPSGRVRHEEKMTVYVTVEELLDVEAARLTLRSRHGLAVDRGRLVREAVAMVLAELESEGEDSRLVRRLSSQE